MQSDEKHHFAAHSPDHLAAPTGPIGRTGIVAGRDPVPAYAAFALAAPAFLAGGEDDAPVAFADLPDVYATDDALAVHLSTLFPEVRPRGYLELRSADAIDVRHHAAAMVFVAGLLATIAT